MRAAHDGLLDIGRPRRPADEVDGAGQVPLAMNGPQPVESLLIGADNIRRGDENGVRLGQEIERGRIVRA